MNQTDARAGLIGDYVAGVRRVLAPAAAAGLERGGGGPTSPAELADEAERLAATSSALTGVLAADLAQPDPLVRLEASTRLLAKALTDLEVSAFVYGAARDEEEGVPWTEGVERSVGGGGASDERLQILLAGTGERNGGLERGVTMPVDLPSARIELNHQIDDALTLISKRAQGASQQAITGLLGIGVTELAQAVVGVGGELAQLVGQGGRATRLYALFRSFAASTYASLLALLGPELSSIAAKKLQELMDSVRSGEAVARPLEALYGTEEARQELAAIVAASTADLAHYIAAIEGVAALDASFREQVSLSEKLFKGLRFFALLPTAALPQARLLAGAAYTVLGGYVVVVGSDYVDARRLNLLNLVPGVRALVETNLSGE